MANSVNSITLTDTNPHTGLIVVVDNFGNQYKGTLGNVVIAGFDPAQDNFSIDPANTSTLDVQDVAANGGTVATLTGDFTSVGNTVSNPNPDPTKPPSVAMTDGTVLTGLTCQVTAINKLPSTASFALQVNF